MPSILVTPRVFGGDSFGESSPFLITSWCWRHLWQLHVPPKVCYFSWKLCQDWIPWKIWFPKAWSLIVVVLLALPIEILPSMPCSDSKGIWKSTGWWTMIQTSFHEDVIDFLSHVKDLLGKHDFDALIMIAWASWNHRDDIIHNNRARSTMDSINHTLHHHEEFCKSSMSCLSAQVGPSQQHWHRLTPRVVAVSTDVAFSANGRHCGSVESFGLQHGWYAAPSLPRSTSPSAPQLLRPSRLNTSSRRPSFRHHSHADPNLLWYPA